MASLGGWGAYKINKSSWFPVRANKSSWQSWKRSFEGSIRKIALWQWQRQRQIEHGFCVRHKNLDHCLALPCKWEQLVLSPHPLLITNCCRWHNFVSVTQFQPAKGTKGERAFYHWILELGAGQKGRSIQYFREAGHCARISNMIFWLLNLLYFLPP